MTAKNGGGMERLLRALAPIAGFDGFDDVHTRRGVRNVALLAVVAWGVVAASPWLGIEAAIAGMGLMTLAVGIVVGSTLSAAATNVELATMLVAGMREVTGREKLDLSGAAGPLLGTATSYVSPPLSGTSASSLRPTAMPPPLPRQKDRTMLQALPAGPELPPRLLSQGEIDGRSYQLFADGSIEMETVFGTRWFASLELAHEFIGFRDDANSPARDFAARLN